MGAITIDVLLTIILVKMIGKLGVERVGICGFTNVKTNAAFLASAAIGSPCYVLVYIRQNWTDNPTHSSSQSTITAVVVIIKGRNISVSENWKESYKVIYVPFKTSRTL